MVQLVSSDGKVFPVRKEVAFEVGAIASLYEALGCSPPADGEEDEPIPLSNVTGDTLVKVIQWIEHHLEVRKKKEAEEAEEEEVKMAVDGCKEQQPSSKDKAQNAKLPPPPGPVDADEKNRKLTVWEMDFFNINRTALISLIMAANYLDMQDLMDCACLAVAKYIRGRSLREIRQRFSLFDDLTMVEKRLLARENQFIDFKASLDADADDD